MIVLDANILIRAVLGQRVGQLLDHYSQQGIRFYAPETAYAEAEEYLPTLLRKKGKPDTDLAAALRYLKSRWNQSSGNPTEFLRQDGLFLTLPNSMANVSYITLSASVDAIGKQ